MKQTPKVSVIIPALNEEKYLYVLLQSLSRQTRIPDEIIVADAGSSDETVRIAEKYGCIVTKGGLPAAGRNAGVRVSSGDILLFLDADVRPASGFIERVVKEFIGSGAVIGTCLVDTAENSVVNQIILQAVNLYLQVIQPLSPRAPGFCIIVTRKTHEAIGGFDETLALSEDHDYLHRALGYGNFHLITGVHISTSMRRLEKEGLIQLGLKYLWCEMNILAGRPIRSLPFVYDFGKFEGKENPSETSQSFLNQVRHDISNVSNPLLRMSKRELSELYRVLEMDPVDISQEYITRIFRQKDIRIIHSYLKDRLKQIRDNRKVKSSWSVVKSLSRRIGNSF